MPSELDIPRVRGAVERAVRRLRDVPMCRSHLDYGLPNAFPRAVIDWQHEDVRRAAGRPSLTGPGRHSPQVSARVPAELRDAAERQARREGKSVSQLIRELLERYLSGSPDGVRH
jgi:hypothetical protein